MELFQLVANQDVRGLKRFIRENQVDVNIRSPEDGSTPLHFAASMGDLACLDTLLEMPGVIVDAQNNEGNTPLHVATAYTHLQAVKKLLKAGDKPHSLRTYNHKQKTPLEYAWNPEVKAFLEEYDRNLTGAYFLPSDSEILRKKIIDMCMQVQEFQEKCKETIWKLIEQKHVALHKAYLLEQAAGIKDADSSGNYINQLSYYQETIERQNANISSLKEKIRTLEASMQQQREEVQQMQEQRSSIAATKDEAPQVAQSTEKLDEELKIQEDQDEKSRLVVFVTVDNIKMFKGGTKEKLVERLTGSGLNFDLQYLQAFLLTFRQFMTPDELLSLLVKSYENSSLLDPTTAIPVRLRLTNTLKNWIENYWFDFEDDEKRRNDLSKFVNETIKDQPKLQIQLTRVLERKLSGEDAQISNNKPMNCPKPIYPKKSLIRKQSGTDSPKIQRQSSTMKEPKMSLSLANLDKIKGKGKSDELVSQISDFDPLEIARQMTLIEFEMFKTIKPTEFLDQAWLGKDKEKNAPGVVKMAQWSNRISRWVVTEILSEDSAKTRAALYERFVFIAQHLEKLNNFNGCIEILTALQSSPLYRLKETLNNVNAKIRKLADELMKETSSELNYKKLRERVHAADPPLIPFPGVYLQDLVFLDAGSKSFLDPEKKLINFQKHQTTARYIQEIIGYQNSPYSLEPVLDIQEYLKTTKLIESEDEQYNRSLECEPRTN